jgi:hypothetical protein
MVYARFLADWNSVLAASRKQNQSPWLYLDAANTLFQSAKKRAYTISKDTLGPLALLFMRYRVSVCIPLCLAQCFPVLLILLGLEELPKWKLLAEVLEEIETEIAYGPVVDLSKLFDDPSDGSITLLRSIDCEQRRVGSLQQRQNVLSAA